MSSQQERERRIDFIREGFQILCDGAGIEIRVTDYHAEPLRIPWVILEQWRGGDAGTSPPDIPPPLAGFAPESASPGGPRPQSPSSP